MINVEHQLPDFIQTDYPGFVEFLKAYYEWYEKEYSVGYFGDLVDLDNTIDSFLQHFRKELDIFGITNDGTSRFYLRHLKELYTAKGSRTAIEFLFKILYDKTSTIKIPWDYTAIASGGKWTVPFSIVINRVNTEGENGLTLEQAQALTGKEITLLDSDGNPYQTVVEYVNQLPNGDFEVFIGRYGYNRIPPEPTSFTFEGGDYTYPVEATAGTISIIDPGTGFAIGDIFDVHHNLASGMRVRVSAVGPNGEITGVEIISFGVGYNEAFNFVIDGNSGTSDVVFWPFIDVVVDNDVFYLRGAADGTTIKASYDVVTADAGDRPHGLQTGDAVIYRKGAGANTAVPPLVDGAIYYVIFGTDSALLLATTFPRAVNGVWINLYEGATGKGHSFSKLGEAILRFTTNGLRIYPGYYAGGSVLGDGCFIEDSYYYQVYSYVTILEETLAKYRGILKDVLHPAGTRNFGEQTISLDPDMPTIEIGFEMDEGEIPN